MCYQFQEKKFSRVDLELGIANSFLIKGCYQFQEEKFSLVDLGLKIANSLLQFIIIHSLIVLNGCYSE